MKKRNILVAMLLVFAGLFLAGCNSNEQTVGLIEASNNDMYNLLNDDSNTGTLIYIGLSTCPFCHEFEPILIETLEYLEKGLLHYEIDTAAALDDESEMTMHDIMTTLVEQTDWAWTGGVPALVYMFNGEVINFTVGVQPKERIIEFFNMDHFNERTWHLVPEPEELLWETGTQLTYVSSEDVAEILGDMSGTGTFVYIGTPHCPFCREFEPILNETLVELGVTLRYFQVHDPILTANQELTAEIFDTLMELAGPIGWGGGVPVVMYFSNGQVIDIISGVQQREVILDFFERNGGIN